MSDLLSLDARHLTLADLKRARAGPLSGRNPIELLSDPLERMTLIIWCVRTRHDPEFTWADAEQAELYDFEEFRPDDEDKGKGEQPADPPDASPGEPSARPETDERPPSEAKPRRRARSTSSGRSSASPEPSTTP